MNKNKKKYIIIGIIAVIIIGAIIYFSPRSTNHSHNNTTIDNSYDENFGNNNDVITEPVETEAVTANQNNNFEINYPDETVYFVSAIGATKLGMKITDVKASTKSDGDVYLQIELEKISQSNATNEKIKENEEKNGLNFFISANIYDKNEMIIDTDMITFGNLPFNDPIGTKYTFTRCLYSFDRDNIDIAKIDIVERH